MTVSGQPCPVTVLWQLRNDPVLVGRGKQFWDKPVVNYSDKSTTLSGQPCSGWPVTVIGQPKVSILAAPLLRTGLRQYLHSVIDNIHHAISLPILVV